VLGLVLVTLLGCAACSADPGPTPSVQVAGEPGALPQLRFEAPLDVPQQHVEVLSPGAGPALVGGQPVLLDLVAESAVDGSVLSETYTSTPRAFRLTEDSLGPDLFVALRGKHVGDRVLQLAPGRDGYPATVAVYDVLSARAVGEPVPPREGLPAVTLGGTGEPRITIPANDPPASLVAQPLIRGTGPQIEAGQVVTVQYVGVLWSDGSVVDTTWGDDALPADLPIGVGSVPDGWDQGLVEQTVGSQVLLVLPPGTGGDQDGLADQTLVYVVDILAASGGPEGS
jgi:peptidylprolyl isomerase